MKPGFQRVRTPWNRAFIPLQAALSNFTRRSGTTHPTCHPLPRFSRPANDNTFTLMSWQRQRCDIDAVGGGAPEQRGGARAGGRRAGCNRYSITSRRRVRAPARSRVTMATLVTGADLSWAPVAHLGPHRGEGIINVPAGAATCSGWLGRRG